MDPGVAVILLLVILLLVAGAWYLAARRRPRGGGGEASAPSRARPTYRSPLAAALRRLWAAGVGEDTWRELEEVLLAADLGVESTETVVARVRDRRPATLDEARAAMSQALLEELDHRDRVLRLEGSPAVILVVGVNGTGKTTTIAKLARLLQREGRTVLLAAADTFRAAASEQLAAWADRLGVEVVSGQEGGDPASVTFDAIAAARRRGVDVVVVDTAGRLHAKKNLMAELGKIHRVAAGDRGRVDEVLLVLDATSGQNGVVQVAAFAEAVPVSGVVLTKLDGTAKGGIVVTVERRLGVPVKFVGVGEGLDDLVPFEPPAFVAELLEQR